MADEVDKALLDEIAVAYAAYVEILDTSKWLAVTDLVMPVEGEFCNPAVNKIVRDVIKRKEAGQARPQRTSHES